MDQVLRPFEFDEAISDKFVVALTVSEYTFHVTFVEVAADTELAVTPPNNPATVNTPTSKIALNRIGQHYSPANRSRSLPNILIGDSVAIPKRKGAQSPQRNPSRRSRDTLEPDTASVLT